MNKLRQSLIRISSFIIKELVEVLRQTPLILTLVLGPFLIMLLFGLGYRNRALELRTLFVYEKQNMLSAQVEDYAKDLGPQLIYTGLDDDKEEAFRKLRQDEVDLVVLIPPDALDMIRQREKVIVQLVHNQIDPYQVSYVQTFGNVYIDAMNRRILESVAEEGQKEALSIQSDLQSAQEYTEGMRSALEAGDIATAQSQQRNLSDHLDTIFSVLEENLTLLSALDTPLEGEEGTSVLEIDPFLETLAKIRERQSALENLGSTTNFDEDINQLQAMENDLDQLESQLEEIRNLKPDVLVAPLANYVVSVHGVDLNPADFFAPAVVVLLLQHLSVTFAALTIVRERKMGMLERFRIAPISALETLLGKYISYLLLGSVLAGAITAILVFLLKVPMLGGWLQYALVVVAMLFTSLGVGFLISMFAQSDLQAVQYAMFLLLGSVFFSGFFLDLRYLWEPVQVVSWSLPATYGIQLLQDIMLRGYELQLRFFIPLIAIGTGLFFLSWYLLADRFHNEEK